jgi:hypothetical protein
MVNQTTSASIDEPMEVIQHEKTNFCVADVRKRLGESLQSPKKQLSRDPEDPSGWWYK